MEKDKQKIRSAIKYITVLAVIVFVLVNHFSGMYAKYISEKTYEENPAKAQDFFFTVDLLGDTHTVDSTTKTYELKGGSAQEINFDVRNYFDELRITEKDIEYTISVDTQKMEYLRSGNDTVELTEQDGSALQDTYILTADNESSNAYTLSIPSGYKDNTEVSVTIQSTAPYQKTMKLVFKLSTSEHDILYYVEDMDVYANLVIVSNIEVPANKIVVQWNAINENDNNLQVDSTSIYLRDTSLETTDANKAKSQGGHLKQLQVTKGMNIEESISIYFFKTDKTKNYSTTGKIGVNLIDGEYTIVLEERGNQE